MRRGGHGLKVTIGARAYRVGAAILVAGAMVLGSAAGAGAQHGNNPPSAPAPPPAPPPAPAPPPGPTITGFSPTAGPTGSTVTITGIGFTATSQVNFSGAPSGFFFPALFKVVSDTTLTATVPALATTGPIQVITSGGTPNAAT